MCVLEQPREDNFSAGPNNVLCKTRSVLCVYLNSQEKIILVRGPIGSDWSNWLKADPGRDHVS